MKTQDLDAAVVAAFSERAGRIKPNAIGPAIAAFALRRDRRKYGEFIVDDRTTI